MPSSRYSLFLFSLIALTGCGLNTGDSSAYPFSADNEYIEPVDSIVIWIDEKTPHYLSGMRLMSADGMSTLVMINPLTKDYLIYDLSHADEKPKRVPLSSEGIHAIPRLSTLVALGSYGQLKFLSINTATSFCYLLNDHGEILKLINVDPLPEKADTAGAAISFVTNPMYAVVRFENLIAVPCVPIERFEYKGPVNSLRIFDLNNEGFDYVSLHPFPSRFENGIYGQHLCFTPLLAKYDSNTLIGGFAISDSFSLYNIHTLKKESTHVLSSRYFRADDAKPTMKPDEFVPNLAVKERLQYFDWLTPLHYKLVCDQRRKRTYLLSNAKPPTLATVKERGGDYRMGSKHSIAIFDSAFRRGSEFLFNPDQYLTVSMEIIRGKLALIPRSEYQPYEDSLVIHLFDL